MRQSKFWIYFRRPTKSKWNPAESLNEPVVHLPGTKVSSFTAQCPERIFTCRANCRNITCSDGYREKKKSDARKDRRIARGHIKQHGSKSAYETQRSDRTYCDPAQGKKDAMRDHPPNHVPTGSAQSEPNRQLLCALQDRIRHHAIDADGR